MDVIKVCNSIISTAESIKKEPSDIDLKVKYLRYLVGEIDGSGTHGDSVFFQGELDHKKKESYDVQYPY